MNRFTEINKKKDTFTADPYQYFPNEVFEHILSFLPSNDLVKASEVNSSWYNIIARSKQLMSNIRLKISCKMYLYRDISFMISGIRRYDSLEIEGCAMCIDAIFSILKLRPWKNIIVTNTCFETIQQLMLFFKLIEKNVSNLELSDVNVRSMKRDGVVKEYFTFPKLNRLVVKNVLPFLFYEVFPHIRTLTQLDFISNDQDYRSKKAIADLLMINKQLEVLNILNPVFNAILYKGMITLPFRLKKLSIINGSYRDGDYYSKYYENLAKVLDQQSDTLETVILDDWLGEDVLKAVFKLQKLKNLTISGFTQIYINCNYDDLILTKNESIQSLDVFLVPENFDIFKQIIIACPNLNSLSMTNVDFGLLCFINQYLPDIRKVSIGFLNTTSIPRRDLHFFRNLHFLEVKDILPCVLRKKYHDLNRFEELLHDIMKNRRIY